MGIVLLSLKLLEDLKLEGTNPLSSIFFLGIIVCFSIEPHIILIITCLHGISFIIEFLILKIFTIFFGKLCILYPI